MRKTKSTLDSLRGGTHFEDADGHRLIPSNTTPERWVTAPGFLESFEHCFGYTFLMEEIAFEVYDDEE